MTPPKSDEQDGAPVRIILRRGGVYLTAALCRRYFHGLDSVILMRRGADLVIMPVRHAASGGYLLKLRNAAGDRVINAPDFLRSHGLNEGAEAELDAVWSRELAGLVAQNAFKIAN